jgi:hypothetical protein
MIFGVRLGQLGCSLLRWLGGDWGCSGDLVPGGEPVGHFAAVVLGAQPALSTCSVRRMEEIIQCMVEEGRSGPLGWFRRLLGPVR